jgi:hypothetical protein
MDQKGNELYLTMGEYVKDELCCGSVDSENKQKSGGVINVIFFLHRSCPHHMPQSIFNGGA